MKDKKMIVTVLAVISLVVITIGVSYAFFNYMKEGTKENSITTGSITFLYTEVSKVGRGIELSDAYPISDEEGKMQVGEGKVFEFKVTSTTPSKVNIPYEVTARKKADSTLDEEAVKVYLTEVNGEEKGILLDKYSNLEQTSVNVPSGTVEKTIYTGIVSANNSNYEKNFRLRMWIDSSVDFSPVKDEEGNDIYPYNNKTFTLTVNVYANGKVVTGELNTDTTLAKLELTGCTLEPAFDSSIEEYSCSVKNSVDTTTITGSATSDTTKISGLGTKSLSVGENTFIIKTLAENGDEKTYIVKVNRKKYASLLKDEILKSNTLITAKPTLTDSSNNISDASGLYSSTATNSGDPTYYFRGNVTNNYVSFAGQTWRIVRINEDGTVRIIIENGVGASSGRFNSNYNNYTYMYYSNSEAKTTLENWYNTNIGSKSELANKVASGDYYCEQAKVKYDSSYTSGNATMTLYSSYTPNFKCSNDGNGKGIVNANIGLLTYDEVIYAGGYFEKENSDYYLYEVLRSPFWTMSPAGFSGSIAHTWRGIRWLFKYSNDGVNGSYHYFPTINLKTDVQISSGSGTSSDPYVIDGDDTNIDDNNNDTEYTKCADEGSVCTLPSGGNYTVRFGANGQYYYLYNQSGSVNCSRTTFGGDPISGTKKQCEYWTI